MQNNVFAMGAITLIFSFNMASAGDINLDNWGHTINPDNTINAYCGKIDGVAATCSNTINDGGFMQRTIIAHDGSKYIQTIIADKNSADGGDGYIDRSFIKVGGGGVLFDQQFQETTIIGSSVAANHEIFNSSFQMSEGNLFLGIIGDEEINIFQTTSEAFCDIIAGGCDQVGVPLGGEVFGTTFALAENVDTLFGTADVTMDITQGINDLNDLNAGFSFGKDFTKYPDGTVLEDILTLMLNQDVAMDNGGSMTSFNFVEVTAPFAGSADIDSTGDGIGNTVDGPVSYLSGDTIFGVDVSQVFVGGISAVGNYGLMELTVDPANPATPISRATITADMGVSGTDSFTIITDADPFVDTNWRQ